MTNIISREELKARVGVEGTPSAWLDVDQDRINAFADATLDHQFIHVDPERAAETPFGGTIAHGYLTLSLIPHFAEECIAVPEGIQMVINYGLDKLRFMCPVPVGSRVRAKFKIIAVQEKGRGARILVTNEVTIEIEGEDRPALIAETLSLFMMEPPA